MRQFILAIFAFAFIVNSASAQEYHVDKIVWSPDGRYFALLLSSFTEIQSQIKIYNAENLELEYELWNVTANAFHLAWSPDSQRIVTNDYGDNAYIRTLDGTLLASFGGIMPGYDVIVEDSAWNFDGSLLAEMNHRTIIIRDGTSGNNAQAIVLNDESAFIDFVWSESENTIAISTFDKRILIVDAANQTILKEISTTEFVFFRRWQDNCFYVQNANIRHLRDDADYRYIYQILDSETGDLIDEVELEDWDSIWATQFSMDASLLLIKRSTGIVEIWDVATWTIQQSLEFPLNTLVSLNPDNTKLLVVSSDTELSHLDLPLNGD